MFINKWVLSSVYASLVYFWSSLSLLLPWVFEKLEIKIRFWTKKAILLPHLLIFWKKLPFGILTEMSELLTEKEISTEIFKDSYQTVQDCNRKVLYLGRNVQHFNQNVRHFTQNVKILNEMFKISTEMFEISTE